MLAQIGVGVAAGLISFVVWALAVRVVHEIRTSRARLSGWYWQAVYNPNDPTMGTLWSIELMELHQRGRELRGVMYRVYRESWDYRWEFRGRLSKGNQINLFYFSTGESEARNGTMRLRALASPEPHGGTFWSGAMRETPDSLRELAVASGQDADADIQQIGADFSKDAPVEWLRADRLTDDPRRIWLASWLERAVHKEGPTVREVLKRELPEMAYRVLTESPPHPSRWVLGLEAASAVSSPLPMQVGHGARRQVSQRFPPQPWSSPTAKLLGLDIGKDEPERGEGSGR